MKLLLSYLNYLKEGGGSDNESARYGKETKFLGKRFSNKTLNFTVDYPMSNLNVILKYRKGLR